jgi:hypothetical protein
VHVTKAFYGLLVSAMLFYQKLRDEQDFEINPYDPCVANILHDCKQLTVCRHVDDLKASHQDPQVIDNLIKWLHIKYGTIGELKVTSGKIHEYFGMTPDYSTPGKVSIGMS